MRDRVGGSGPAEGVSELSISFPWLGPHDDASLTTGVRWAQLGRVRKVGGSVVDQSGHEPAVPDGGIRERSFPPRQPIGVDRGEPAHRARQLPK